MIGPATRIVCLLTSYGMVPLAIQDPPVPPVAGPLARIADEAGNQLSRRTFNLQSKETQRVLWVNVYAATWHESGREKALAELAALTAQASQDDLLTMACWFETIFFHQGYPNDKVLRHLASLLDRRHLHRLSDRAQGRLGNRFSRWFRKPPPHMGAAIDALAALLPFLQGRKRRQAALKLIELLPSRDRYLKTLLVDTLMKNGDFIAPEEFRAAALTIIEDIERPKRHPRVLDWSLPDAAYALERLMPRLGPEDQREMISRLLRHPTVAFGLHRFIPVLEDKIGPIIEIENRWRQGVSRLGETLESAISSLTVPDRLALLERLMAPDGLKGLFSPTASLILKQVPPPIFAVFVERQGNPEWKKLYKYHAAGLPLENTRLWEAYLNAEDPDRFLAKHGLAGPFR